MYRTRLRHGVQLRVRFVQTLVAAVEEPVGRAVIRHGHVRQIGVERRVPHHGSGGRLGRGHAREALARLPQIIRVGVAELLDHGLSHGVAGLLSFGVVFVVCVKMIRTMRCQSVVPSRRERRRRKTTSDSTSESRRRERNSASATFRTGRDDAAVRRRSRTSAGGARMVRLRSARRLRTT